jgi:hypothetical protein
VTIASTVFDSQDAKTLGSQVSSRRDDTLVTSLQPSGQGDTASTRMQEIIRYVRQYDGGDCFFIAPVAVSETGATLEGYGVSTRAFEGLDVGFLHKNGFEASIGVRIVSQAQCPAVSFLGRLRQQPAPRLHIDSVSLRAGEPLTGSVEDDEGAAARFRRRHGGERLRLARAWYEPQIVRDCDVAARQRPRRTAPAAAGRRKCATVGEPAFPTSDSREPALLRGI